MNDDHFHALCERFTDDRRSLGEAGVEALANEAIKRLLQTYSPADVLVAVELLRHNMSAEEICEALLLDYLGGPFNVLAYHPSVRQAYVDLALARYGDEAKKRSLTNKEPEHDTPRRSDEADPREAAENGKRRGARSSQAGR